MRNLPMANFRSQKAKIKYCWDSSDQVPVRSWALFKAKDMLRELIQTLKAQKSVVKVA